MKEIGQPISYGSAFKIHKIREYLETNHDPEIAEAMEKIKDYKKGNSINSVYKMLKEKTECVQRLSSEDFFEMMEELVNETLVIEDFFPDYDGKKIKLEIEITTVFCPICDKEFRVVHKENKFKAHSHFLEEIVENSEEGV